MRKNKSKVSRNYPRVYCRFGDGNERHVRFCTQKPFEKALAAKLAGMIEYYMSSKKLADARRPVMQSTIVHFYLGNEGRTDLVPSLNVNDKMSCKEIEAMLVMSMEEAHKTAREVNGLRGKIAA